MSPRSEELWRKARDRLHGARNALVSGDPEIAVSAAYYGMLYAARAALSERDLYSKTHSGTWNLLASTLETAGEIEAGTAQLGRNAQERREASDYGAADMSGEEAEATIADAERLFAEIENLLG